MYNVHIILSFPIVPKHIILSSPYIFKMPDVGIHVGRREGQLEPARLLQKQVYIIYFISNLIIYFVYTGFTI